LRDETVLHGYLVATLDYALSDYVTLTFDLIFIGGRGIVMDYSCAKFGDFSFSCFGFIVRTGIQTHTFGRFGSVKERL